MAIGFIRKVFSFGQKAEVPAEVPEKLVAEAASMAPPASRRPANREMRFIWTSFQGRPSLRPLPQD